MTAIKMTKKNRLAILKGARKILSKPENWTVNSLRRRKAKGEDGYGYCVLGAIEESAYRLGLAEPDKFAFRTSGEHPDRQGIGYELGKELSLYAYSRETQGFAPDAVNDHFGYTAVVGLLDGYIAEVEAGRPRKENNDG